MSESPPNVQPPTREEIRAYAEQHHLDLTDEEVEDFAAIIPETLAGYERLDELADYTPLVEYTDRDFGYKPDSEEDPLNAFVTKCEVNGADSGLFDGYTVGLAARALILKLHINQPYRAVTMCNLAAQIPAFRVEHRPRRTHGCRIADVPAVHSPN